MTKIITKVIQVHNDCLEDKDDSNMHVEAVFQAIQCMTFTFIHLTDVLSKVTQLSVLYYKDKQSQ